MEGGVSLGWSSDTVEPQTLSAKVDTLLSSEQVGNGVSNQVDTAPEPPVIVRRALKRQTCERSTIEAIYEHVPEAKNDKAFFRWVVYALWTSWRDKTTLRRVIHHKIMDWIGAYRFDSGEAVLQYIQKRLPIEFSDDYAEGSHTRQILDDGLPEELWKVVKMDLNMSPADYGTRVYVLSGRVLTKNDAVEIRKQLREEVARMKMPSETSRRIQETLNDLPPRRFNRFQDRIGRALEYVDRMEIDVGISPLEKAKIRGYTGCEKDDDSGELTGNVDRYKARVRHEKRKKSEQQRNEYKRILHCIAHQHKPFYKPSRQERTDRVFSNNDSALLLPSEVRDTLCEGLCDVDLKSAHLYIAAWLWGAEEALEQLTQEGYSIWEDLMEHCRPLFEKQGLDVPEKGTDLYGEVKAGMKIMVYSTVYGMGAPSIQAEVTKSLQHILGSDVGDHLTSHPVINNIREKRDEVLAGLEPGDVLETPSGIDVVVEVGLEQEKDKDCQKVGPRSALASQAQAYEQELMSVLLGVADDRRRFKLMLWLHDGAVCKARYPNAVKGDVNEALEEKRRELTEFAGKDTLLPALFEVEEIEAPELPPKTVDDRIVSAGGCVLRLKEGETAVRVDSDTGEELGPAVSEMLLKHEHELYKIAGEYIRITGDGYTIESDPYPEEKLWQPLTEEDDNSPSSTNSTETQDQKDQNQNENQNQRRSRPETAPGAESRSKEEPPPSRGSDTSTTSASPASPRTTEATSRDPLRHFSKSRREAIREESRRASKWRAETPEPDLSAEEVKQMRSKTHLDVPSLSQSQPTQQQTAEADEVA